MGKLEGPAFLDSSRSLLLPEDLGSPLLNDGGGSVFFISTGGGATGRVIPLDFLLPPSSLQAFTDK